MNSGGGAGETKSNPSGWTTDTLHSHISALLGERDRFWLMLLDERDKRYEQRFVAQMEATTTAYKAASVATSKAELAIEKRLENTNEWREAMNDRDQKLIPRAESEAAREAIKTEIKTLTDRMNRSEGRGLGLQAGWGYLGGAIIIGGIIINLIMRFFIPNVP